MKVVRGKTADNVLGQFRGDLGLILAAWLLSLGIDFFLHAGVFAHLYLSDSPFLLPAGSAFARIPLGYLSFLFLTLSLWWLLVALGVRGPSRSFQIGLSSGAVVWGALLIGLFSISSAPPDLLIAWWVGQSVELGAAAAVIGAGRIRQRRRALYLRVALACLACVVATVFLQAVGWAPAMESIPTP